MVPAADLSWEYRTCSVVGFDIHNPPELNKCIHFVFSIRIFHIGDMHADIVGANRVGITTCWLNREGKAWNLSIKPDYEVGSLRKAAALLGRPLISEEGH